MKLKKADVDINRELQTEIREELMAKSKKGTFRKRNSTPHSGARNNCECIHLTKWSVRAITLFIYTLLFPCILKALQPIYLFGQDCNLGFSWMPFLIFLCLFFSMSIKPGFWAGRVHLPCFHLIPGEEYWLLLIGWAWPLLNKIFFFITIVSKVYEETSSPGSVWKC